MIQKIMNELTWQCSLLTFLLTGHADPALVTGHSWCRNNTAEYFRSQSDEEVNDFLSSISQTDKEWLDYRGLVATLVIAERS